jgi:hypothetical protein
MLRRIEIENFKGVGQRVELDLKPVTLLFGPNSAGKSTVLHAIHYAHAILQDADTSPSTTPLGGDGLDLGGFESLVHNHDLDRVVGLAFEYDVDDLDAEEYLVEPFERVGRTATLDGPDLEGDDAVRRISIDSNAVNRVRVELDIRWSKEDKRAVVVAYRVRVDDRQLGTIEASNDGKDIALTEMNTNHPALLEDSLDEIFEADVVDLWVKEERFEDGQRFVVQSPSGYGEPRSFATHAEALRDARRLLNDECLASEYVSEQVVDGKTVYVVDGVEGEVHSSRETALQASLDAWDHASTEGEFGGFTGRIGCLPGRSHALPRWKRSLQARWQDATDLGGSPHGWGRRYGNGDEHLAGVDYDYSDRIATRLDVLMVAAGGMLLNLLGRLRYVGAVRPAPPRTYRPPSKTHEKRWASGMGAWDALCRSPELRRGVEHWLGAMKAPYSIKWLDYLELPVDLHRQMRNIAAHDDLNEVFQRMTADLPRAGRLVMRPLLAQSATDDNQDDSADKVLVETGIDLHPCDLGEGIAWVVAIIAAALVDQMEAGRPNPMEQLAGVHRDPEQHRYQGLPVELKWLPERQSRLVVLEEPATHIHPRMQVVLGDLFLWSSKPYTDALQDRRQFLIETHSEHLLLRLLKRVRETGEGDAEGPNAPSATSDDVRVYYVLNNQGEVALDEVVIDDFGNFQSVWPGPGGFFEERFDEMY